MENKIRYIAQNERQTEKGILFTYSLYTVGMMIVSVLLRWGAWIAPVIFLGMLVNWIVFIRRDRTYEFRAYVLAVAALVNFFVYGIHAESFFGILSTMSALVILLAILGIKEIIRMAAGTSLLLLLYHGFVIHTIAIPETTSEAVRMLLQISSIFTVECVTYYLVKTQIDVKHQLLDTIETLKAAEKGKDDFVSNVSHEIRTPIHAISGISEMLLMNPLPEEVLEQVQDIQMASRNLLGSVNDILDFSELQSGKIELVEEEYDIASSVRDVANMGVAWKKDKKIDILVDCDPKIPTSLLGDEQKIHRVMEKLVNNAVKFTKKGSITITVRARKESYGVNLIVSVKDTGIGIQEENLEKIYSNFNQVDMKKNRQESGIGLGLAIAKAIVERMGGFISIRSTYGVGTEARFVVPQKILKENSAYYGRFVAPEAKVLVVDDNLMNLKVVKGLLKPYEIQVFTAESGMEALDKIVSKEYDFIFMDHMMPGMDGVETVHQIREKSGKYYQEIPIIALTANAIGGAREMFLSEGFQDFVAKPIDQSVLDHVLRKYVPEEKIQMMESGDSQETSVKPITDIKKASDNQKSAGSKAVVGLQLDGVDVEQGIQYSGGTMENYLDILKAYDVTGRKNQQKLQEFWNQKDWKAYQIQVHGVKSTSYSIGAVELGDLAKELEAASQREDESYLVQYHSPMMEKYEYLLNLIEKNSQIYPQEESTNEVLEEIDQETYQRWILQLKEQLDSFESAKTEELLKRASGFSYQGNSLRKILEPVQNCVDEFDFIRGAEELALLQEKMR